MKGDYSPSIICGLVNKPSLYKDFIKETDGKYGMKIREIRFIDIGMPLDDKNYNKSINYFKNFLCPILSRGLNFDFPFKSFIENKLNKIGLHIIKLPNPQRETKNKFNLLGFTPLFIDDKYMNLKNEKGEFVYSEEEKKNCLKLRNFESNFKPIINNEETNPNLIFKDEELK